MSSDGIQAERVFGVDATRRARAALDRVPGDARPRRDAALSQRGSPGARGAVARGRAPGARALARVDLAGRAVLRGVSDSRAGEREPRRRTRGLDRGFLRTCAGARL